MTEYKISVYYIIPLVVLILYLYNDANKTKIELEDAKKTLNDTTRLLNVYYLRLVYMVNLFNDKLNGTNTNKLNQNIAQFMNNYIPRPELEELTSKITSNLDKLTNLNISKISIK